MILATLIDWYYKVLPDEDTDDQDAAQALGQLSDGDGDEDNTMERVLVTTYAIA